MQEKSEYIVLNINEIKFIQAELSLISDHLEDIKKHKVMAIEGDDCNIKHGIDFLFNYQRKAFRLPIKGKN